MSGHDDSQSVSHRANLDGSLADILAIRVNTERAIRFYLQYRGGKIFNLIDAEMPPKIDGRKHSEQLQL